VKQPPMTRMQEGLPTAGTGLAHGPAGCR
jgi:hypothetical protein